MDTNECRNTFRLLNLYKHFTYFFEQLKIIYLLNPINDQVISSVGHVVPCTIKRFNNTSLSLSLFLSFSLVAIKNLPVMREIKHDTPSISLPARALPFCPVRDLQRRFTRAICQADRQ